MEHVIERFTWHYVPFTDYRIPFGGINMSTVVNTLLVVAVLLVVLWYWVRRFSLVPGRGQMVVELLVGFWDQMVSDTFNPATDPLYEEKRHRFVPFLSPLFAYILLGNLAGALPVPFIQEPTSDLNCTLALGVYCMTYATFYGFYYSGWKGVLSEAAGPFWETKGARGAAAVAGKASALLFFPIHVMGDLSKLLSLSFRLFGNIVGGATIMAVAFMLLRGLYLVVGLEAFFIGFEAIIQAFVFAMLTLAYTAVAIRE